jgi:Holliday junction resolvase RusA-like endonuclease
MPNSIINLTVQGEPKAQPQAPHRPRGGISYVPKTADLWRLLVRESVHKLPFDSPQITGPVELSITFWMPRPQYHYGTGKNKGVLKPSAPTEHTFKPDLVNMIKAVEDAISDTQLWKDDALVWKYGEMVKKYGLPHQVGADIQINYDS